MNLYRVTTKKGYGDCGVFHVVAQDAGQAYAAVRAFLDNKDLCFTNERALDRVELLAEGKLYPECGSRLLHTGGLVTQ